MLRLTLTLIRSQRHDMAREQLTLIPVCELCQDTFPSAGWTVRATKLPCVGCGFLTHFRLYALK